jgi:hypothetical protein
LPLVAEGPLWLGGTLDQYGRDTLEEIQAKGETTLFLDYLGVDPRSRAPLLARTKRPSGTHKGSPHGAPGKLAWSNGCKSRPGNRRLAKDVEATIESSVTWLYIASVKLMSRRLAAA